MHPDPSWLRRYPIAIRMAPVCLDDRQPVVDAYRWCEIIRNWGFAKGQIVEVHINKRNEPDKLRSLLLRVLKAEPHSLHIVNEFGDRSAVYRRPVNPFDTPAAWVWKLKYVRESRVGAG